MPAGSSKRWYRFLEESSFIRHYLWKYKKWVGVGLLALITVDLLDILPPIILKSSIDIIVDHRPQGLLVQMALFYLWVSIFQGICRYGWRMYLIRSSIFAGKDLRQKYAHHLFSLSSSFFERHPMGDLMSLATNDVEAIRIAIGTGVLVLVDSLFYILTVPIAMYFLSPKLTLLVCLPLPMIPIVVFINERKVNERFEQVQKCFGKISAFTQENLNGIRVVKAFAREETQIQRMRKIGEEYVRLNLSLARVQSTLGPVMDFLMSLGLVILLFWGGSNMIREAGAAAIGLGTFVAFQRYIQKMVWPMAALGMALNYYQRSVSSSNRLKKIFAVSTDIPEAHSPYVPLKKEGRVEFKDLNFSFPGSSAVVLSGINLVIERGERVALIGTVGSGKSAILSLLPRLYPVDRGSLWIDGVDINDWPLDELRRQIGYVSQDVFLFSETVMDNIAFGLHEWAMKSKLPSIEEMTRLASVHDEITRLPSAYRTRLGERGVILSGGQKQRLTIARALAMEPPILVLDDALSSVDVQTEEKILRGIRTRKGRNTEIIAAHRISTIKDSDRIVVLQGGRIAEVGTHTQLMARRGGSYWKLYEQQQLKEELDNYQNGLY